MGAFWGRWEETDLFWFLVTEQLVVQIYHREPVVVRKGDVVFDVGSHLGTFTRYALDREPRLVVAFDPNPTNNRCFKQTFEKEIKDGKVILIQAALWETPGTLLFSAPLSGNSGTGRVHPNQEGPRELQVPATTLDETVAHLRLGRVDFIKMDIEGAERHALRGGRQTLSLYGPRMALCVYHRPDDLTVIPQIALEARPEYHVFMSKKQAYFY